MAHLMKRQNQKDDTFACFTGMKFSEKSSKTIIFDFTYISMVLVLKLFQKTSKNSYLILISKVSGQPKPKENMDGKYLKDCSLNSSTRLC